MKSQLLGVIMLIIATTAAAHAQQAVFLIRHAEQVHDIEDPPLTPEGQQRAREWANILRDSGIAVVYTSKKARTRQTGEPIAKALNVPLQAVPRKDVQQLVDQIQTLHAESRVLIVSHSRQIAKILKALGYSAQAQAGTSFGMDEYDNLFVAVSAGEDNAAILRLHY